MSWRLEHVRDSLMICLAIPGERWEVELFEDGSAEIERSRSPGRIEGGEAPEALFESLATRE